MVYLPSNWPKVLLKLPTCFLRAGIQQVTTSHYTVVTNTGPACANDICLGNCCSQEFAPLPCEESTKATGRPRFVTFSPRSGFRKSKSKPQNKAEINRNHRLNWKDHVWSSVQVSFYNPFQILPSRPTGENMQRQQTKVSTHRQCHV